MKIFIRNTFRKSEVIKTYQKNHFTTENILLSDSILNNPTRLNQIATEFHQKLKILTFQEFSYHIELFTKTKNQNIDILHSAEKYVVKLDKTEKNNKIQGLLIIAKYLVNFKRKNFLVWENIEEIFLYRFEDLNFQEKIELFFILTEKYFSDSKTEFDFRNSIIVRKLFTIYDKVLIKSVSCYEYVSLLKLVRKQHQYKVNNSPTIYYLFTVFPDFLKKMNQEQGINSILIFIELDKISVKNNNYLTFITYLKSNLDHLSDVSKVLLLRHLFIFYDDEEINSKELFSEIVKSLKIRRDFDLLIEDLNVLNELKNDSRVFYEYIFDHIENGNTLLNNLDDIPQDETNFFKNLDFVDEEDPSVYKLNKI